MLQAHTYQCISHNLTCSHPVGLVHVPTMFHKAWARAFGAIASRMNHSHWEWPVKVPSTSHNPRAIAIIAVSTSITQSSLAGQNNSLCVPQYQKCECDDCNPYCNWHPNLWGVTTHTFGSLWPLLSLTTNSMNCCRPDNLDSKTLLLLIQMKKQLRNYSLGSPRTKVKATTQVTLTFLINNKSLLEWNLLHTYVQNYARRAEVSVGTQGK